MQIPRPTSILFVNISCDIRWVDSTNPPCTTIIQDMRKDVITPTRPHTPLPFFLQLFSVSYLSADCYLIRRPSWEFSDCTIRALSSL